MLSVQSWNYRRALCHICKQPALLPIALPRVHTRFKYMNVPFPSVTLLSSTFVYARNYCFALKLNKIELTPWTVIANLY